MSGPERMMRFLPLSLLLLLVIFITQAPAVPLADLHEISNAQKIECQGEECSNALKALVKRSAGGSRFDAGMTAPPLPNVQVTTPALPSNIGSNGQAGQGKKPKNKQKNKKNGRKGQKKMPKNINKKNGKQGNKGKPGNKGKQGNKRNNKGKKDKKDEYDYYDYYDEYYGGCY